MEDLKSDGKKGETNAEAWLKPDLVQAIFKTIHFYDLFDFPLTAEEIKDQLYKYNYPLHIKELRATLGYLTDVGKLAFLKDYYVLPRRETICETRKARKFIAEKLWNRTKLYGQYLRNVPFVEMIAVCNNLAYDNPNEQSDIDLFIVIRPGRLWLARLIITLILQFFGVRRHGGKIAGRFCLSFFVTTETLDIYKLALSPEDPYLAYWIKNLAVIYDEGAFDRFKKENQKWLESYGLRFSEHQKRNIYLQNASRFKKFSEWLWGGWLGNGLEFLLKKTLKKRTLSRMKHLGEKSNVIVTDDMLKFHDHDRRDEYRQKWKSGLSTPQSLF